MHFEGRMKKKWIVPAVIAAVFLGMVAAGFLTRHAPDVFYPMFRETLKQADEVQGGDISKLRLPKMGSSPAAIAK